MMQLGLTQALEDYPKFSIVGQASDGYAAVDLALALKPDVIVMDIGLPRLDGMAATQQIRAKLSDVQVVMLTSHTAETEIISALSSGADAYCVKGAEIERLVTAIGAAQEGAVYLDPQIARRVIENLKPPATTTATIGQFSPRELDVLKLVVEGYSNPEIANALYLSPNTVKTHIRGIMNKLAVDDRV